MNMFGLPPTNPQLSCREQLPSAITIPKLEISNHASSTIGSDCGETDKDLTSTSTTPMSNYMRRSTPTSRGDPSHFQKNILSASDINNDITQYLSNLHLSEHNKYIAQKDDLLSSSISEASAELHYNKISTAPLEHSQSCRSIDTQPDNRREVDQSLFSLDPSTFGTTFDQPLQPAATSFSAFGQQTEDRRNSMYTSSVSSGSSLELDFTCKFSSDFLPASATTGTACGRTYSGDNYMPSYEAREFVPQAARYSAAAPAFIPQLSQFDDRAYPAGDSALLAPSAAAGMQYRRPASSAVGYATASQAPLPISRSQSHQLQQYGQQQQLSRSPPQLPMQPQQQQYQQAGCGEAYYGNMVGVAPTRAVQQLQGYATTTAPRYGEAPALPMPPIRSNATTAGYKPSPVPMQHAQHQYQQQYQCQASAAMGMPHLQDLIYQVQFKRGCRSFTLAPRANFNVSVHDFVVVEGDRGEDLGIVVDVLGMQAFMERRMNMSRSAAQQDQDDQNVGCILRLATLQERQMLPDKFHTEKDIVQSCNELARYGFGLPIVVLDAELQFDRRKLTLYYDCSVRIDFRDFVRQLYATYKARIWMRKLDAQLDQQQPEVQPFAAMALATGVQFSQGQGSSSISNHHRGGSCGY